VVRLAACCGCFCLVLATDGRVDRSRPHRALQSRRDLSFSCMLHCNAALARPSERARLLLSGSVFVRISS
jgi:hypothetical protein